MEFTPSTLVKALKADRTHHGYTYTLGRNDCPEPFSATHDCSGGGLYACRLSDLLTWVSLYPDIDTVAVVEVPEDAQFVDLEDKVKASSLVLTRFIPLIDAVTLALDHGADLHYRGDYSFRMACSYGNLALAKCLYENGAVAVDEALHTASEYGHLPVVQFLVEHGASTDARVEALLRAASEGHLPIVEYLAEHGARETVEDNLPLEWASENDHMDVVCFLIDHGAEVMRKTKTAQEVMEYTRRMRATYYYDDYDTDYDCPCCK